MKKTITVVSLMLALLLLLGCGSSSKYATEESMADYAMAEEPAAAYDYSYEEEYDALTEEANVSYDPGAGATANAVQTQKLIQNFYLTMTVEDPSAAMAAVTDYVRGIGGYLLNGNDYYDKEDNTGAANLTLRVPTGHADQLKEYLGGLGKIDSSSSDAEDVTAEYYDVQFRIEQGKAELEVLNELLLSCTSVEEVLQVRQQIYSVQSDVEALEGRMKVLSELTTFDTVYLTLNPVRNIVSTGEQKRFMTGSEFFTGIGSGLSDSLRVVVNGLGYLVIFLATVLLPVLVFGGIAWLVVCLIRKIVRKRRVKKGLPEMTRRERKEAKKQARLEKKAAQKQTETEEA